MINEFLNELGSVNDVEERLLSLANLVDKEIKQKSDLVEVIALTRYDPFQDWLTKVSIPIVNESLQRARQVLVATDDYYYI